LAGSRVARVEDLPQWELEDDSNSSTRIKSKLKLAFFIP